jgi:hypothetical protein
MEANSQSGFFSALPVVSNADDLSTSLQTPELEGVVGSRGRHAFEILHRHVPDCF